MEANEVCTCTHGSCCIYCSDRRPCLFPRCVAFAAPGWHYCVVHHPEKILARVENVVLNNFAIAMTTSKDQAHLKKLHDDLLHDLRETV